MPLPHEIMNGLQGYGLMDLIKNHPDVFESAFCPTEDFKWTYAEFSELLTPEFNEEGSSKKKMEVDVFKFFMDFVERCFEDGMCYPQNDSSFVKFMEKVTKAGIIPCMNNNFGV